MKKFVSLMLAGIMMLMLFTGCGGTVVDQVNSVPPSEPVSDETPEVPDDSNLDKTDLTEEVSLRINYAAGNKSRTLTYNQVSPLTMPDGTTYTAGMLKPMWNYVQTALNCKLTDVTTQDQKASEMIDVASTTNFAEANISGGQSRCESGDHRLRRQHLAYPLYR